MKTRRMAAVPGRVLYDLFPSDYEPVIINHLRAIGVELPDKPVDLVIHVMEGGGDSAYVPVIRVSFDLPLPGK